MDLVKKLAEIFEQIPFNRMLGLRFEAFEKDHIVMRFDMKNELVGNYLHGILHGGVISSVLDMAGGVAAMLAAAEKHHDKNFEALSSVIGKTSTIDLHINYLRPGKGEHFLAKAWVMHPGNKITFTRMELHNQEILIATASATYLVG